ncbi:MAG: signal peptidase I [Lachnospiraceae bacterium]|nr:signal peptidase I [Lachnospiraceae bacterium]
MAKNTKKETNKDNETGVFEEVFSWIVVIVLAIGLAVVIKTFVIINANIPSGSMENTIMTGDRLFGYRLAYLFSEPERGDIIIFKYPDDETESYVKRIIGLPGEIVRVKEGKIYIDDNEEPLDESYLKEEWTVDNDGYVFQVPENSYLVMGDNRNYSYDARYWTNEYVSEDKILGKAGLRYFPFDTIGFVE